MTLMNLQLANTISGVAGVTGQKIVHAIVYGERDPQVLATYRDCRIKAAEEEIAASLLGNWGDEHLFALEQAPPAGKSMSTKASSTTRSATVSG